MTGKTHREISIVTSCAISVAINELKFNTANAIEFFVMLPIMYEFGMAGARFPDYDLQSIHEDTPLNEDINKVIRLTGGTHRSWQTHSLDICLITYVLLMMFGQKNLDANSFLVLAQIATAFWVGWLSHLLGDALSKDGFRIFFWNKDLKIRVVPKNHKKKNATPFLLFIATIAAVIGMWQFISILSSIIIGIIGMTITYISFRMYGQNFTTGQDSVWESKIVYPVVRFAVRPTMWFAIGYGILNHFPQLKQIINIPNIKDIVMSIVNK